MDELLRTYVKLLIERCKDFEAASDKEEIIALCEKTTCCLRAYSLGHLDIHRLACVKLMSTQVPVYVGLASDNEFVLRELKELCISKLNEHLVMAWKYCADIEFVKEHDSIDILPRIA